jgi:hypothetical protein
MNSSATVKMKLAKQSLRVPLTGYVSIEVDDKGKHSITSIDLYPMKLDVSKIDLRITSDCPDNLLLINND